MKRIFYIGMNDITLFYWEQNEIVEAFQFSMDEEGQVGLFRAIERDPSTLSYALVDIIEEEFFNDTVVHVSGSDRKLLNQRKLKSHFRNALYAVATAQGRHPTDASKDALLLSAITNPAALSLLLSWIQVYRVPLQGIYSVPYVNAYLLQKIGINQAHCLYVSIQKNHYLRLSYFQRQALKSSRLARISVVDDNSYAEAIKDETHKLVRYLNRLQLLPQATPLVVNIVCDSTESPNWTNTLESNEHISYSFLGLEALAGKTHFGTTVTQTSTELLYAHVLAIAPSLPNYAQKSDRQFNILRLLRRGLAAASIGVVACGTALSAYNILKSQDHHAQLTITAQRNSYLNQQLQQLIQAKPKSRYSAEGMRDTITLTKRLERARFTPAMAYVLISKELKIFPNVEIDSLQWVTYSSISELPPPIRSLLSDTANTAEANQVYRVITLATRLNNYQGNTFRAYQDALAFVEYLKKNNAFLAVLPLEMPVNTNSAQEVSGDSSAQVATDHAPLKVQLVLQVTAHEP